LGLGQDKTKQMRGCGTELRREKEERVPPAAGADGRGDATLSHHKRRRKNAACYSVPIAAEAE